MGSIVSVIITALVLLELVASICLMGAGTQFLLTQTRLGKAMVNWLGKMGIEFLGEDTEDVIDEDHRPTSKLRQVISRKSKKEDA